MNTRQLITALGSPGATGVVRVLAWPSALISEYNIVQFTRSNRPFMILMSVVALAYWASVLIRWANASSAPASASRTDAPK